MLVLNKKNIINKIIVIFLIFIVLLGIKSFAVVKPTDEFYVNDYANLLNNDTKNYIIKASIKEIAIWANKMTQ